MIREEDLQEAIAECQGKRNPDANTCIKLAAYYTILNNLYPKTEEQYPQPVIPAQSFAAEPEPEIIDYQGDSEFARLCRERSVSDMMPVLDELMDTLQVLQPRLYDGVMRRLRDY
jgi:hypothetical protein